MNDWLLLLRCGFIIVSALKQGLDIYHRLTLNLWQSSCLSLQSTGNNGLCHHKQHLPIS